MIELTPKRRLPPVILLALFAIASSARAAERPNLVFFLTDDQRWDALGCMGNAVIRTPNVDRLATGGVVFDRAFCTTSICMTSRASYITGQYERRHGINTFRQALSPAAFANTFPARLKAAGYRIGFIGKWGLANPLPTEEYDYWRGFVGQGRYFSKGDPEHITRRHERLALEFLDGCEQDRPFCLQVSFKAPHCQDGSGWPFQPDPRYDELYRGVPVPRSGTESYEEFRKLPGFIRSSIARERWYIRFATPEMQQQSVHDYFRLLAGVDAAVGAVVARLAQKGLAENTVIVFTSDNGFYLGEHGLAGKWFAHEESIRLPLVIYDPRLDASRRGRRRSEMTLNIDIAPTLLDLAGVDIPREMQGRSLVPLLRGETPDWRTDFFYEHRFPHPRIPRCEGVRSGRWKYMRYIDATPVVEELYDLEADPLEQHDLAGSPSHADELAAMRARWEELRRAAE